MYLGTVCMCVWGVYSGLGCPAGRQLTVSVLHNQLQISNGTDKAKGRLREGRRVGGGVLQTKLPRDQAVPTPYSALFPLPRSHIRNNSAKHQFEVMHLINLMMPRQQTGASRGVGGGSAGRERDERWLQVAVAKCAQVAAASAAFQTFFTLLPFESFE